jgi:tripartite-type tricarboxylate transporter receptor subunit TctC
VPNPDLFQQQRWCHRPARISILKSICCKRNGAWPMFCGGVMKLPRREFLHLAAGAAALPAASRIARAQAYPSRPVRIIVGFAAGDTTDILARFVGQWLSDRLGQQFVIENRPGAANNLATEFVVRAPADGYTLLLTTASNVINATLYEKLNYNFMRDIVPVASICRAPLVMNVNLSVPAKTVPELIRLCQSQPGQGQHGVSGDRNSRPCGWRVV